MSGRTWWQDFWETPAGRERRENAERVKSEERKREEERLRAEKAKAEENFRANEIKMARHEAWVKLHVALCQEIYKSGRPKRADLVRWIGRMAGTNVMGAGVLTDLVEMLGTDLHYETARCLMRLAVATNVVALSVEDPEAAAAMAEAEAKVEAKAKGGEEPEGGTAKDAKNAKGGRDGSEPPMDADGRRPEGADRK